MGGTRVEGRRWGFANIRLRGRITEENYGGLQEESFTLLQHSFLDKPARGRGQSPLRKTLRLA